MKFESSFEEVWEARQRIFKKCHRNPKELVEYYIKLQNDFNKIFEIDKDLKISDDKQSRFKKLKTRKFEN
jgi:hypothetical protein